MFCPNCGEELHDKQKFCAVCGTPAVASLEMKFSSKSKSLKSKKAGKFQKKREKKAPVFKILILLLIVCSAVATLALTKSANNQSDIIPATVPVVETTSALTTQATVTETVPTETIPVDNSPIGIAKQIAEIEYQKYIEQEEAASFMQRAFANEISLEDLYRQPDLYEKKEVYFGGFVNQAVYDSSMPNKVILLVDVTGVNFPNNTILVLYEFDENEGRILEDDYVDIYGYATNLYTYESIIGASITVPAISGEFVYCHASEINTLELPEMKKAKELTSKTYISEDGHTISFPTYDPNASYLYDATAYEDCIVVYYRPSDGWDNNFPHTFYRITLFDDGSIVVFTPDDSAVAGVYSVNEGTYVHYSPYNSYTDEGVPVATAPASQQSTIMGHVIESSGGLNIRSGPGTEYETVGRLAPNASVEIFEQQQVDTSSWGRIDQGWICMDYIVTEGQLSSNTPVTQQIVDQYCGSWADSISDRCMMRISYSNGLFDIEISWGNSAFSTAVWNFMGWYNATTNDITYQNGKYALHETQENGELAESIQYSDGSGRFYISDGKLYWEDYKENVGSRCVFEKNGY